MPCTHVCTDQLGFTVLSASLLIWIVSLGIQSRTVLDWELHPCLGSTGFCFGVGILEFISLETSYFLYRDANLVDVSGLETESSNGKDTLVSIIFLGL